MATAFDNSIMAVENLSCSICLDVFTEPVSIPCGHNFCLNCITDYWKTEDTVCVCPLCKEKFYTKPMLRVNRIIADMAENIKVSVQGKISGDPEQPGNGNVLCAVCTGAKSAALKSCLVCLMSFCKTHLEPHQRSPALKKHKLIDPVENPENRLCKKHHYPLELYCRVDKIIICESCKDSDHKTHKLVTLEEEAQNRMTELEIEKKGTDQLIQERLEKIVKIQHSAEATKNNAQKAQSCSMQVMSAMVEYIKRSQAELTEVIETKQKNNETKAEGFIKELEGEITQIKQKNEQLHQISLTKDPFMFLENFSHFTITVPKVKDWSDVMLDTDQFPVQGAMFTLEEIVTREIRVLCDPDLKEMKRHAVDVTLDPDTAHACLIVSKDGKQVTHGDKRRNVPDKPGRFDHVINVFATKGFSSGKFYYEIQVKDKTHWCLGIANQSINRKGDIRLSPENGYWTIWLKKGDELTANAIPPVKLCVKEMPQKVGVFVDYGKGQVSFYNVDSRSHIYSFTRCNFTEELIPFFSPFPNSGGKNSAPLIITPVKQLKQPVAEKKEGGRDL
ncbi:E3 ubiquitin-protein ligase TRIM39-like [Scomber japonicus]|uniref:E3 ubiquitin-protein ligase TRIM39-like n=1 Tax=Scomber japonicus TaxID=13676 RepID=UPI002305BF96|nr:E3 ubiquitin-protein ligase TRIM39-like [Scomber japonicus]